MAFQPKLLTRVLTGNSSGTQAISDFITANLTNNLLPPQFWLYQAGSDVVATVSADGYFIYFADFVQTLVYNDGNYLRVGDLIYCKCADADAWLTVTSIAVPITTAPLGAGPDSVGTADIQDSAVTAPKIAADAVITAKILNANVTLAKLAAGIAPSHVIKFAGSLTSLGGAAAEAFAVAGAVAATDKAFVTLTDQGPNTVTILKAVVTNNVLTITFSANPGAGAVLNYQLIRAAA
jgi:hypothetical protein